MSELEQILLASAAALILPGLWGWFVHSLFYGYRLASRQIFAETPLESRRTSDADDWYYQI